MPFSFIMGVDWQDSFMVAKLLGYKTFFNEFVAYEHLSKLINLRKEAGPKFVNGVQQYMSVSKSFNVQCTFPSRTYIHQIVTGASVCQTAWQALGMHQENKTYQNPWSRGAHCVLSTS